MPRLAFRYTPSFLTPKQHWFVEQLIAHFKGKQYNTPRREIIPLAKELLGLNIVPKWITRNTEIRKHRGHYDLSRLLRLPVIDMTPEEFHAYRLQVNRKRAASKKKNKKKPPVVVVDIETVPDEPVGPSELSVIDALKMLK